MRYTNVYIPVALHEFILITGWILSVWLNLLTVLLIVIFSYKRRPVNIRPWINVFITACLIFQTCYFLLFNP